MQPGRAFAAMLLVAAATSACTMNRAAKPTAQRAAADQPTPAPSVVSAASQTATAATPIEAKSNFDSAVKPILEKHCRPCHFDGGVMYDKLPFDRAETITTLGERLFTRIKNPGEQDVIRAFLRQPVSP